ncbi:substrate-binding periplasmic protein, partial [Paraglaciecola sp.]|uniref:substrate-binding periplasmic protein n=1 Tax=Paraglaciecola sp. TaxID=1920173 RepID=UPI003EF14F5B
MKVLSKHSRFNFVSARIVLILITCVCWSFTVRADTISVAAGWARPPYINPLDHTGFELDIIRQVLSRMGHKTKVVYVPHQTTIELLNDAQVDIALTLNEGIGVSSERLSDVYINYQNVVLSLSKRNLKIAEIQDLSAFRLVGFQSAKDVLGDEYSNLVKGNSLYFEMADQKKQVELLLQGVVDAIVIDLNVFDYLSTEIAGKS